MNTCALPFPGAWNVSPVFGSMISVMTDDKEIGHFHSQDVRNVSSMFSIPEAWLPFFAFSKKTDGEAFGLPAGKLVRPAFCVLPIDWNSGANILQEAVRSLVFEKIRIPRGLADQMARASRFGVSNFEELGAIGELAVLEGLSQELTARGPENTEGKRVFVRRRM